MSMSVCRSAAGRSAEREAEHLTAALTDTERHWLLFGAVLPTAVPRAEQLSSLTGTSRLQATRSETQRSVSVAVASILVLFVATASRPYLPSLPSLNTGYSVILGGPPPTPEAAEAVLTAPTGPAGARAGCEEGRGHQGSRCRFAAAPVTAPRNRNRISALPGRGAAPHLRAQAGISQEMNAGPRR